jgi:hypothetical protein
LDALPWLSGFAPHWPHPGAIARWPWWGAAAGCEVSGPCVDWVIAGAFGALA